MSRLKIVPFVITILLLAGCSGGGPGSTDGAHPGSGTGGVSLNIVWPEKPASASASLASIPADVVKLLLKIKADDLSTSVYELPSTQSSLTLTIPDGSSRGFHVCGYPDTVTDIPNYYGYITIPVSGDTTVTVYMQRVTSLPCAECQDTVMPTSPAITSISAPSSTEITINWSPSVDSGGISGYRVYRDGVPVTTTTGSTYTDSGLPPYSNHTYTVTAIDSTGNQSAGAAQQSMVTRSAWSGASVWGSSSTDGNSPEPGLSIDSGGNIYVAGTTSGSMDGQTPLGSGDYFLTKFNSSKVKQWTVQGGSAGDESCGGTVTDSYGNVYVTGGTDPALDGQIKIFLSKYDSSGALQWTRLTGTAGIAISRGIGIDSNGYIYVAGLASGSVDGQPHVSLNDIVLMKYDSSGNKVWTRMLGSTGYDECYGLAIDGNDNIYLAGMTDGDLDGIANPGGPGSSAGFITKYDTGGNRQWTRLAGVSGGVVRCEAVCVDSIGNAYVTGETDMGFDGQTIAGSYDFFIVKYDASGNRLWTKIFGSTLDEFVNRMAVDYADNIYITGATSGDLYGQTNTSTGGSGYDMFIVKLNSSGALLWTKLSGTGTYDVGLDVLVDRSGCIYVKGLTNGNMDGNTNLGSSDIFVIKYAPDGATNITPYVPPVGPG